MNACLQCVPRQPQLRHRQRHPGMAFPLACSHSWTGLMQLSRPLTCHSAPPAAYTLVSTRRVVVQARCPRTPESRRQRIWAQDPNRAQELRRSGEIAQLHLAPGNADKRLNEGHSRSDPMGYGLNTQGSRRSTSRSAGGEMSMRRALLVEPLAAIALAVHPPRRRERSGTGSGLSGGRLLTVCSLDRQIRSLPRVRPVRRSRLVMWWIGLITLIGFAACSSSDLGPIASAGSR